MEKKKHSENLRKKKLYRKYKIFFNSICLTERYDEVYYRQVDLRLFLDQCSFVSVLWLLSEVAIRLIKMTMMSASWSLSPRRYMKDGDKPRPKPTTRKSCSIAFPPVCRASESSTDSPKSDTLHT